MSKRARSGGKPIAILVMGMHRSGTSAVTRMLNLLGVDLGSRLIAPGEDNPLGFWEHAEAVAQHERLLASFGMTWDDPQPLPEGWLESDAAKDAVAGIRAIADSDFASSRMWAVKDPRLSRFVPLWRKALKSRVRLKAVIVSREPDNVALSLAGRNGIPAGVAQLLWARYLADAEEGSRGLPRSLVHFEELMRDWVGASARIAAELDIPLRMDETARAAVDSYLTQSLYHNQSAPLPGASNLALPLYEALHGSQSSAAALSGFAAARADFEQRIAPFLPAISGLSRMLAGERRRLAVANGENAEIAKSLAASGAWGASRNSELRELAVTAASLQSRLAEATEWGVSRQAELDVANAGLSEVRVQFKAREDELNASRQELAALQTKSCELDMLLAGRDNELAQIQETLGFIRAERDRLDDTLRGNELEMEALRSRIEQDIQRLHEDLQARAREGEILRTTSETELARKQRELDGLQHQANLLNARLAMVEERLYRAGPINALSRLAASIYRMAKGASKAAVIGAARALPGTPESKHGRAVRLRELNGVRKSGANSASILADLHMLAEGRWPAHPIYLLRAATPDQLPAIDISVVVYDSERWIEGFMASLVAGDYPLDRITLLVRDHSPGDGTRVALERFFAGHPNPLRGYHYSAGRNAGFGSGHNYNFKLGSSPHFLVCNVDGKFHADALSTLMRAVAASTGKVAAWELRQSPYEHPKYYDPVTMLTTWVSGACVLFGREAYREVGGFDDLIFMYGEDVDLSYRLRGRGYKLAYVPHAVFHHESYAEPAEFKPLQFHGSSLANILLRLRFGTWADMLAIPNMWRELGRSAADQEAHAGHLRNTVKLLLLGPLFLLTRFRRGTARIPFARWDFGLRREGAFEPVIAPSRPHPMVSIIVRTYQGRGQLLRQALASIANQTYAPIEVIVVEDKGDDLREIAESSGREFGLDLRFISCIEPGSNRCMTGNIGLAAARGEYLNFLDDDDLFFADHVEFLVARLSARPDLGAVYSLAWETKVIADPATGKYLEVMHSSLPAQRIPFDRDLLQKMNYIPIQSVLFRRELFELYGGFNLDLDNLEDWNLWRRYSWRHELEVFAKTTSVYHIPNEPEKLEARQTLLDIYYAKAKRESDSACETIDHNAAFVRKGRQQIQSGAGLPA